MDRFYCKYRIANSVESMVAF
uniref:Uncharacterized protein n=1 Tax=Anguilla anguilla TaxID=7936 RepID=A0A0E9PKN5_ANGAN